MKAQKKSHSRQSNKQKLAQRKIQVRRQKIILVIILIALPLLLLSVFLAKRRKMPVVTINSACEAYRADVETVAAQYGMSDYVDLILALMMQESSGVGPDVLQSSEGAYNTRYPQVPNGITDVDYSISCGIQELKYAMDKAGVRNPTDMDRIRLALQAYNFGADVYFSYMEEHGHTSWSSESAEAFAQMASGGKERSEDDPFRDPAGPWAYGDQRYPEHVLQYYHPENTH